MKRLTFFSNIIVLILLSTNTYAQLHSQPSCGENFTLDWSSSPTGSNEYNWSSPGALSSTYTDVDGSGIDISIAFSGDTSSFGSWGSINTPKVGNSSSTLYEGLDLYTNGYSATGITCTITFSSPIYALSFDMHHVNTSGANGDQYTITGLDTDGNTIYPTFTNSATPSYTTNNSNGTINATGASTNGTDAIVGVNFSDDNYITSVTFLWQDCTTCSTGYVHGSGLGNFSFCIPQTLDFDGVNDYINTPAFLGGLTEATMMSWIKLDSSFDGGDIMGQRNFSIYIDSNKRLKTFIKTDSGTVTTATMPNGQAPVLSTDLWYHVASVYNGANGTLELFLNGDSVWKYSLLNGTKVNDEAAWNSIHDFEIGRNSRYDNNYFEGDIYETRIYNKALTEKQLHQQINQEIENNNGNIRGTVIPKDIDGLVWNDLILYYKMESINTGYTPDGSTTNTNGKLNNMRTYQERTAPLPYTTVSGGNGDWSNTNNWLYGNVWDITGNHPDCAIVVLKDDLTTNTTHKTVGLIIESGKELIVNDDSGIENQWYLKLDGKIDLNGESQLIQTIDSDLDVASAGTIEKDQQGTQDLFTYNYWSSPVGVSNTTSNNNSYTLNDNIFKDGTNSASPININFVSGYNGSNGSPISIANYWIWKFNNHPTDDYSSWQHVRHTGTILAGEGFTMKGVNDTNDNVSLTQNYVIEGKPNSGNITLPINANNDYLVGNPYPSALDAQQFIIDNGPTITGATPLTTGTIYFWEHWGGGSHNLADYQGGYATYNLSGGIPSASKGTSDPDVATGGSAAKVPGRYIPVAQGFFVTGESNGSINFNNGQRIFQTEGTGSVFVRNNNTSPTANADNGDDRIKIRLGFNSVNEIHRQLLITVDERATPNYDWGFDGKTLDDQMDDMYWMIANEKYLIQGIDNINETTIIPIGLHTRDTGINTITIDALVNTPNNFPVYLHDKVLAIYHDLTASNYHVTLEAGEYLNRFEITFTNQALSTEDVEDNATLDVYFANDSESIIISNPKMVSINNAEIVNMIGQSVARYEVIALSNTTELKTKNISTGAYIIKLNTENGVISKKVLIK